MWIEWIEWIEWIDLRQCQSTQLRKSVNLLLVMFSSCLVQVEPLHHFYLGSEGTLPSQTKM